MANFAIAFCILLVTVTCGAQDSDFSSIMDKITSTLKSYIADGQTRIETLLEGVTNATNVAENYERLVNSTVPNVIAEYNEVIANIAANATGNVSSCISLSSGFEDLVANVVSDTFTCVEDTLSDILSNSNVTITGLQDSMSDFNDTATKAAACVSDSQDSLACITSIWTSMTNTASDWVKLLAHAAILVAEFATVQFSIPSCGFTGPTGTLASEALKSYSEINKCIAYLNSNSTS